MALYLRIVSLIGRDIKFSFVLHTHFPFFRSINPLFVNLRTMVCSGNAIHMLPEGILLFLLSVSDLVNIVFLFVANFFISTPRNLALSFLALVTRVFSSERVSLSSPRNSFSVVFSLRAASRLPHTPIIQSSAYLTYLNVGCALGFGIVEFSSLCLFTTPLISSLIL